MAHLLIIDPQNDFCDYPDSALPVKGAIADLTRLSNLIEKRLENIEAITVSLDSHHSFDIAHPSFWVDQKGEMVKPYTQITLESFLKGCFFPNELITKPYGLSWVTEYLKKTSKPHIIWPEHCIVGTKGHNIFAPLSDALKKWEIETQRQVKYVFKGLNPYTEHFSALKAEVVDPMDPSTGYNVPLIFDLESASEVWVAGEASSHCVLQTVEDINKVISNPRKIKILGDCMSPVTGFEETSELLFTYLPNPILKSTEL